MNAFAGTGQLIRLILRRDRIRLVVWVAVVAVLVISTAQAFQSLYPDPRALAAFTAGIRANPAFVALSGPAYNLDTIGGLTAWRVIGTTSVLVALMSLFHIGRHTRAEEESGRAELLRASTTGRYAAPVAALVTLMAAQAALGAIIAAGLIGLDLPAAGSVAFGAAITGAGWAFAAITLLAAQLAESARAVSGLTGAVIGAAFVLRAVGDVGDGKLSWLSPIGWAQAVRPFAEERWWVLGLFAALVVATVAGSFALAARRDLGAGVIRPRPGPADAPRGLSGPIGLAVRLQRGSIVAWSVGLFLGGLAIGAVTHSVGDLLDSSAELRRYLEFMGGAGRIEDTYLATTLGIFGVMAGAYGVAGALRLRTEETNVRAEPILTAPIPRVRWVLSHLVVVLVGVVVVLTAAGLGAGLTYGATTGDAGQVPRLIGAALVQAPAAWLLAGLAVALFGLVPRWTSAAWAVLVFCLLIGQFGPILQLSDWVLNLSPFTHVPQVPAATAAPGPLLALTAVAAALTAAGLATFQRRDVG